MSAVHAHGASRRRSAGMSGTYSRVALDHPLATLFDYAATRNRLSPASPCRCCSASGRPSAVCEVTTHTDVPPSRLRAIDAICTDLPPLSPDWLALVSFAADYYQRGRGEVALPARRRVLRDAGRWGGCSRPRCVTGRRKRPRGAARCIASRAAPRCVGSRRRWSTAARWRCPSARALHPKAAATLDDGRRAAGSTSRRSAGPMRLCPKLWITVGSRWKNQPPALTDQQAEALDAIRAAQGFAPFLLHGVTGSGKTEVHRMRSRRCSTRDRKRRRSCSFPKST